ncbi:hypothetical protein R7Q39_28760 [Vibrio sp. 947]|uniref:hypothetical protein n=1 Tax=Vibrio TaxID=662 RepID=UPI001CDC1DFB|nr:MULTISPECIES: hypothetical protein [Vibrio]MCA2422601.1 hypothetical protein [Vibrio alginolyticus]MCA2447238.1 hypothetical protein [Vibrio alginolyticus]MDW1929376.1 hypothetical protein [Vibrio sp. 947]MDW1948100.1 hypothetical protein [Vibrio sp. 812(2023)]MDW1990885.1 hypothetical protein [Vibrio sp. 780]
MKNILLIIMSMTLFSCSNYQIPDSPTFNAASSWAIMPMTNNANTPMAAEKAEQLVATQLYAKGIRTIRYPATNSNDLRSVLDSSVKQQNAQAWLATQPVDYVITGSIEEWHYKSGLDGEPAVGLTLEIQSAKTGEVYWRASGSRVGWGRESITGTGQVVIENLLDGIVITRP